MNAGWPGFWHHDIMNRLGVPDDLHLEFPVHHNQMARLHSGGINPC